MRSLFILVPLVFTSLAARAQTAPPFEPKLSNDFGTRVWREAAHHEENGTGNRLVSPIANYLAWSMVLNGTEGKTRDKLIETLGVPVDELALGRINGSNRDCQDILKSPKGFGEELAPVLTISNGAWVSSDDHGGRAFDFSPEFTRALEYFYGALPTKVSFKSAGAAGQINAWFDEKTQGLIPRLVDQDEVKDLLFLLANATYFRGAWAPSFHEVRPNGGNSSITTFTLADGTRSPRTMIRSTAYFAHVHDEIEELIEIPFVAESEDNEFVFYAALPNHSHQIDEYRHADAWARVVRKLDAADQSKGSVILPKFQFEYGYAAVRGSPLAGALDLEHLFEDSADLSALTAPDSVAAKVGLYKSLNRIELDEKGVKAAAAVIIGGIATTSVGEGPSYQMKLDRPFAFAIADKVTGALIFVGEVADPN